MIESQIVEPNPTRLPLSNGQWVVVKAELNAGETMDLFERAAPGIDITEPGAITKLSPTKLGLALCVAYVLDWSFIDPQGAPMLLRGVSVEEKEAMLRLLKFDRFIELMKAISAHDAETRQKKEPPDDATASSERSISLAAVGGGTNG